MTNDARLADARRMAMAGVRNMILLTGDNPDREGVSDTPRRVIDALIDMTRGLTADVGKLLSVSFEAGDYDQAIVVAPIPFTSVCEHHLLPFTGHAFVAYIPSVQDKEPSLPPQYRVVGLSKIPRVVDAFSQRLQLQERLTAQIANAMQEHLRPRGVAVVLRAEHSCMSCRGVRKTGTQMITSVMYGAFKDNASARAEVLKLMGV